MTIKRLDHVSVVVDDLVAAIAFFTALGMTVEGQTPVEGPWVDRINGLESVQVDIVTGSAICEARRGSSSRWPRPNVRFNRRGDRHQVVRPETSEYRQHHGAGVSGAPQGNSRRSADTSTGGHVDGET